MRYIGSKNRISKELVPVIQSYINENTSQYIEPFVGGANVIDKIQHSVKIGYDVNEYLIELLKKFQSDDLSDIPLTIQKKILQKSKKTLRTKI